MEDVSQALMAENRQLRALVDKMEELERERRKALRLMVQRDEKQAQELEKLRKRVNNEDSSSDQLMKQIRGLQTQSHEMQMQFNQERQGLVGELEHTQIALRNAEFFIGNLYAELEHLRSHTPAGKAGMHEPVSAELYQSVDSVTDSDHSRDELSGTGTSATPNSSHHSFLYHPHPAGFPVPVPENTAIPHSITTKSNTGDGTSASTTPNSNMDQTHHTSSGPASLSASASPSPPVNYSAYGAYAYMPQFIHPPHPAAAAAAAAAAASAAAASATTATTAVTTAAASTATAATNSNVPPESTSPPSQTPFGVTPPGPDQPYMMCSPHYSPHMVYAYSPNVSQHAHHHTVDAAAQHKSPPLVARRVLDMADPAHALPVVVSSSSLSSSIPVAVPPQPNQDADPQGVSLAGNTISPGPSGVSPHQMQYMYARMYPYYIAQQSPPTSAPSAAAPVHAAVSSPAPSALGPVSVATLGPVVPNQFIAAPSSESTATTNVITPVTTNSDGQ
jgi:hypothetical protein